VSSVRRTVDAQMPATLRAVGGRRVLFERPGEGLGRRPCTGLEILLGFNRAEYLDYRICA